MKKIQNTAAVFSLFAALLLTACHKAETVDISTPVVYTGTQITSDTLSGTVKGTLLANKTYYFSTDIVVNAGDTLFLQEGVKLIAVGDGTSYQKSPEIRINGTFISLGSETAPNWITVMPAQRVAANAFKGIWGGIQGGASSGDFVIKWTHIEYVGGPAGPASDPVLYTSGAPRYGLAYTNINGNFIFEDSWISNTKDNGMLINSGKFSVMRNTFENNGESGGEAVNVKSGAVGDCAYNVVLGAATNAFKISNSGGTTIQCNVNCYNNTILNCGFRQVQSGRGASINYEKGCKGKVYNNLIANCRFGFRLVTDADVANTLYDNQYYYGNAAVIVNQFYPSTGVAVAKPNDIKSATAKDKNPLFAGYDVNAFDYSTATIPMSVASMPAMLVTAGSSNFRPNPGSPALNKGRTDFSPMKAVTKTGTYGTDITLPGVDMGAYLNDGTGNKH